jgi:hypothetical protein
MVVRMLIVIKQAALPGGAKKLSHRFGIPARVIPIEAILIVVS